VQYGASVANGEDIGGRRAPDSVERVGYSSRHGGPRNAVVAEDGALVSGGENAVGGGAPDGIQMILCPAGHLVPFTAVVVDYGTGIAHHKDVRRRVTPNAVQDIPNTSGDTAPLAAIEVQEGAGVSTGEHAGGRIAPDTIEGRRRAAAMRHPTASPGSGVKEVGEGETEAKYRKQKRQDCRPLAEATDPCFLPVRLHVNRWSS
jgi:hypothetical protein